MTTDLEGIVQRLKEWCRAQPVRLCVLFGSQATGRTHAGSDVDVARDRIESALRDFQQFVAIFEAALDEEDES